MLGHVEQTTLRLKLRLKYAISSFLKDIVVPFDQLRIIICVEIVIYYVVRGINIRLIILIVHRKLDLLHFHLIIDPH
jgi:hypothetical protein